MQDLQTFEERNRYWAQTDRMTQNLDHLTRRAFILKVEDYFEPWNVKAFVMAYPGFVDAILHTKYTLIGREMQKLEMESRKWFGLIHKPLDADKLNPLKNLEQKLESLAQEVDAQGFTSERRDRFVTWINQSLLAFQIKEARFLSEMLRDPVIRKTFQEHFDYPIEDIDLTNGDHLAFLGFIPRWSMDPAMQRQD